MLKNSLIQTWETGSPKAFSWISKPYVLEQPRSYSAIRAIIQGSVTCVLSNWQNGVRTNFMHKNLVPGRLIQRVPREHCREVQIALFGTGSVEYFLLTESMEAAAQVIP